MVRKPPRSYRLWIVPAALTAVSVLASACTQVPEQPAGTVNILFENDMFGSSRDQHFTHGTQLSWLSPPDAVPDEIKAAICKQIPLRRMAAPDEIAGVSLFLCSDDASYVTGQLVFADGGATLGI